MQEEFEFGLKRTFTQDTTDPQPIEFYHGTGADPENDIEEDFITISP